MKFNENISYSKAILNKLGISPDNTDYTKIREICGKNVGYIGILTKIRFVDEISDMDEIESIFHILKDSKIDINKLNRMSYDQILDIFYDDIKNKDNKDYEMVFKDSSYTYYKINTYVGNLKLGSPSWCLKTKSKWDEYISAGLQQWVVVSNDWVGKLLTPDTFYLGGTYNNESKPWVRYGISTKEKGDFVSYLGNDDNNRQLNFSPRSWTAFGILYTIFNIIRGDKKSYYEMFRGCELIEGMETWHKITDIEKFNERVSKGSNFKLKEGEYDEYFVKFSKGYSFTPIILACKNNWIEAILPVDRNQSDPFTNKPIEMVPDHRIINYYIDNYSGGNSPLYLGFKLSNGKIGIEEIKSNPYYFNEVGKWIIIDWNKEYYLIINKMEDGSDVNLPTIFNNGYLDKMENPYFWFYKKIGNGLSEVRYKFNYHYEVDNFIKGKESRKIDIEKKETGVGIPKKNRVSKFLDFIKRK
jgi:hypothetical protein